MIWISSYPPRKCGIAYYSDHYIKALRDYARKHKKSVSIKIISHIDASEADYPIIDNKEDRTWHYQVLKILEKEKPDVVHIQHEYGLYETYADNNERLIDLIKMIKELGTPVVMTFHSVYAKLERNFQEFMEESLKHLDAGIVHEVYQKESLRNSIKGGPRNVYVLPHGSREDIKFDKEKLMKEFGYPKDTLIVGSAGLVDERKGFKELIKQWPKVVEKFPNALLVLELKPHFEKSTRDCLKDILKEIVRSSAIDNIEFIVRSYTEIELYKRLASFDILVLPYKSESQSGMLAHGFSVGTPSIGTDIEGLGAEIKNSKSGIAVKHKEDFYKEINKLLADKNKRKRLSENALRYVKNVNGWSIIARKTFEIYERFW